jgi:16S rRNA (cytosine967-C5)-methyltransferase
LVNAVLRRAADPARRPPPPTFADTAAQLAFAASCPPWIARRFMSIAASEGCELLPIMESLVRPAHPTLRARIDRDTLLARLQGLGIDAVATPHASSGIALHRAGAIDKLPGFAHDFIAQDEAAQWAISFAASEHGPTLDACAAPGGKTIALFDFKHSPLTAMDSQTARCKLLRGSLSAAAVEAEVVQASAEAPPFAAESFATIVLDAPCTGSGTLRRHPEMKLRLAPDDVERLAILQASMLRALAPLVRVGGALIYSVCSVFPEEGASQIEAFLRATPGFVREDLMYSFKYMETMDGFYSARVRRKN